MFPVPTVGRHDFATCKLAYLELGSGIILPAAAAFLDQSSLLPTFGLSAFTFVLSHLTLTRPSQNQSVSTTLQIFSNTHSTQHGLQSTLQAPSHPTRS